MYTSTFLESKSLGRGWDQKSPFLGAITGVRCGFKGTLSPPDTARPDPTRPGHEQEVVMASREVAKLRLFCFCVHRIADAVDAPYEILSPPIGGGVVNTDCE